MSLTYDEGPSSRWGMIADWLHENGVPVDVIGEFLKRCGQTAADAEIFEGDRPDLERVHKAMARASHETAERARRENSGKGIDRMMKFTGDSLSDEDQSLLKKLIRALLNLDPDGAEDDLPTYAPSGMPRPAIASRHAMDQLPDTRHIAIGTDTCGHCFDRRPEPVVMAMDRKTKSRPTADHYAPGIARIGIGPI
jgi:hypothetical protein